MSEEKYLTVGQVVEQLLKLNQEAILTFNIKQHNKVYGRQLRIIASPTHYGTEHNINHSYGGACINLRLPEKAIISNWPKDKI